MGIKDFFASLLVKKQEKQWAQSAAQKRQEAESLLKRLEYLRVADPQIKTKLQGLVLVAEQYFQAAEKAQTWDPECHASLEACRELLDVFQREKDAQATEDRFGLQDADPLESLEERVSKGLSHHTQLLREAVLRLGGDPWGSQRLSIEEELR